MKTEKTIVGNSREYLFGRILPDNCICAEIGVRTGDNADRILTLSNPKELYLIDPWDWFKVKNEPDPEQMSKIYNMEEWYQRVKNKYINKDNVKIIRESSVESSKQFEDEYFDWVYIDAAHDYLSVKEDCESWWSKIKQGGYLCGHDYRLNEEKEGGVTKAVNEFLIKNNLELYYKGDEQGDTSEWCTSIKK